jgi:hypothetical protein
MQMAQSSIPPKKQAAVHMCHDFKCSPHFTSSEAHRELLMKKTLAAAVLPEERVANMLNFFVKLEYVQYCNELIFSLAGPCRQLSAP